MDPLSKAKLSKAELIKDFPKLNETGFRFTSCESVEYNCIAWAAEDTQNWWWPLQDPPYFWPLDEYDCTTECFVRAFQSLGYEVCQTADFEEGYKKVALYVNDGNPSHMARQLSSGVWTSKCGPSVDITHELEGLTGETYGQAEIFMRKSLQFQRNTPLRP